MFIIDIFNLMSVSGFCFIHINLSIILVVSTYYNLKKLLYQKWSEIVLTKIAVKDLKNNFGRLYETSSMDYLHAHTNMNGDILDE